MSRFEEVSTLLQRGKAKDIAALVEQLLKEDVSPKDILNEGLISGMDVIGRKFKNNEIFVPEVLIAARAMNAALAVLKPALAATGVEPIGKAVICTVKGDLHALGKTLVRMLLEGAGIEVIDLGVDVAPEKVVDAVKEHNPDLLCLSALLTTTMMAQKDTITALVEAGIRDKVKIMVGGAPVTQAFADEIGADGYVPDARERGRLPGFANCIGEPKLRNMYEWLKAIGFKAKGRCPSSHSPASSCSAFRERLNLQQRQPGEDDTEVSRRVQPPPGQHDGPVGEAEAFGSTVRITDDEFRPSWVQSSLEEAQKLEVPA